MPRTLIKPGTKYNYLTTLYDTQVNNTHYWICRCDCGNETKVQTQHLKSGGTKSCGCKPRNTNYRKVLERTFGDLTPIKALDKHNFLCECKCGNQVKRSSSVLYTNPSCTCEEWRIREKVKEVKEEVLTKVYELKAKGLTKPEVIEKLGLEYEAVVMERIIKPLKGFAHIKRKPCPPGKIEGKKYGSLTPLNKVGDTKYLCHCSTCGNYINLPVSIFKQKPRCTCDNRTTRTKIKDIEARILADIFRLNKNGFTPQSIFDELKDEYDIAFVKKVMSEVSHLITN